MVQWLSVLRKSTAFKRVGGLCPYLSVSDLVGGNCSARQMRAVSWNVM